MLKLKLLKYQNLVNKELKRFIQKYMTTHTSEWGEKFNTEISDFLLNGGKRLRPILATLIYDGTGGKDLDSFVRISLSAEILHNSTLFHDDLIDESDMRRGRSSFHKVFETWFKEQAINDAKRESETMAILAGDYLNFLSLQCVLDSNFSDKQKLYVINVIRETSETVIKGQILDDEWGTVDITEKDYIKLIEMKTASVFEYATKVATTLSGTNYNIAHLLWGYAKNIGCAFQIQDDILGIFGRQRELGKPITSDLAEGKKTILIIKAYEFSNNSQKRILDKIIGNKNIDNNDVEKVKVILRETGALDYAKDLANKYSIEAIELIKPLNGKVKDGTLNILSKLPTFIINRKF